MCFASLNENSPTYCFPFFLFCQKGEWGRGLVYLSAY